MLNNTWQLEINKSRPSRQLPRLNFKLKKKTCSQKNIYNFVFLVYTHLGPCKCYEVPALCQDSPIVIGGRIFMEITVRTENESLQ